MASCAHFDVLELFSWKTHFRFSFRTFLGGSGIAMGARPQIRASKSDLKTPLVEIPWRARARFRDPSWWKGGHKALHKRSLLATASGQSAAPCMLWPRVWLWGGVGHYSF